MSTPWAPREGRPTTITEIPAGSLVAHDYQPHRLLEAGGRPFDLWPEEYRRAFTERHEDHTRHGTPMPAPEQWCSRPVVLVLQRDGVSGGRPEHRLRPAHASMYVLPEHYAICHRCGELPPCRETVLDRAVAEQCARMAQLMAIAPGHCLGCGQRITHRMNAHRFAGANLWRPDLGDDSAVFHARRDCSRAAAEYDAAWAAAEPGRRCRLFCEGLLRHHFDGSAQCSEGESCPGDVGHGGVEYHRPGQSSAAGCWCVSGDLAARLDRDESETR